MADFGLGILGQVVGRGVRRKKPDGGGPEDSAGYVPQAFDSDPGFQSRDPDPGMTPVHAWEPENPDPGFVPRPQPPGPRALGSVVGQANKPSTLRVMNGANEPQPVHTENPDVGFIRPGTVVGRADAPMTMRHMNGANAPVPVHPEHDTDSGFSMGYSPSGRNQGWMPPLQRMMTARPDSGDLSPGYTSEPDEPAGVAMKRQERRTPSRQRYFKEVSNLPTEQEYIEAHRPHGFGGRLLSAGKYAGREFLLRGLNPGAAFAGLTLGLADKDSSARAHYRESIEPQAVSRQRRLLEQVHLEEGAAAADEDLQNRGAAARRAEEEAAYKKSRRPFEERLQEAQLGDIEAQSEQRRRPPVVRTHEALRQTASGEWVDFSDPQHPYHTGEFGHVAPEHQPSAAELQEEAAAAARVGMAPRDTYIKTRMDKNREGYYGQLGITAIERQAASRSSSDTVNPAAQRVAKAEEDLYRDAEAAYKDELERKTAENRLKGGGGSAGGGRGATASSKRDPRIGRIFKEKGTGRRVKVVDIDQNGDPVRQYVN